MAIPPTGFTNLLYAEKTPAEMYERLKIEHCLSADGLNNRSEVIALISEILRFWNQKDSNAPIVCGGGPIDDVANELLSSKYVNDNARRLHQPHLYKYETRSSWWKFWQHF